MTVKQDKIIATEMEEGCVIGAFRCRICGLTVPNAGLAVRHVKADWRKIEARLELWTRKVKQ